ncbi:MAG TPA: hypothetical protein VLW65_06880 [Bryobacteraceae bacterium]|nr:hypothetical protein [Bryobacteraceae bacterium]
MDFTRIISTLYLELEQIDRAIRSLERLAGSPGEGGDRRNGQPGLRQTKPRTLKDKPARKAKVIAATASDERSSLS